MLRTLRFGLISASVLALSAGAALADFELNILHINDLHSRIESINKYDSTCSEEEEEQNECFGGIARVKTAIEARRGELEGQNVLTLDAGDQFQGSLFYTTYKSAPIAEFMNGIGFDAMAIGNHEFDDGPEELAKFIDALNFPMISGNTLASFSSPVMDKYEPYIVKDFGGEKVAIVSVLATDTDETSSPGDTILFAEPIAYLKETVKELEGEGIDKIILLSHIGYEADKRIAAAVDGIDVIVGGHSHTLLSSTDDKAAGPYPTVVKAQNGIDIPIVTAYAYSKYLGDLKVVFDDDGVVKSTEGAPRLIDASVVPDEGFKAKVAELGGPIEDLKKKEIGESTDIIDGDRNVCRAQECSMGNLVADAMVDRVEDQGVTIAIQNGGGLRSSIDAGTVTMGEVITVLPFQNTLATFDLKGSDIVAALENGLSQIEEGAGRFPQVSGMKYTFDAAKEPGSRVVSVEVKEGDAFVPLDPDKTYGLATNNYMRGGGDGYSIFESAGMNAYDYGPGLEIVVADYIEANSPYKPYTDGRIAAATAQTTEAAAPADSAAPETPITLPDMPSASGSLSSSAPDASAFGAKTYTVIKGDTLWDIAESLMGDGEMWMKIAETNALSHPNVIAVGQELKIPAN